MGGVRLEYTTCDRRSLVAKFILSIASIMMGALAIASDTVVDAVARGLAGLILAVLATDCSGYVTASKECGGDGDEEA